MKRRRQERGEKAGREVTADPMRGLDKIGKKEESKMSRMRWTMIMERTI